MTALRELKSLPPAPLLTKKSSRWSRRRFKRTARSPSRGQRGWARGDSLPEGAKAGEAPAIGLVRNFRSTAGQPADRKQPRIIRLSVAGHRALVQSKTSRSGALASGDVAGSVAQAIVVLVAVSKKDARPGLPQFGDSRRRGCRGTGRWHGGRRRDWWAGPCARRSEKPVVQQKEYVGVKPLPVVL